MTSDKSLTREELTEKLHARIRFERRWSDRVADFLTHYFGTVLFLILNILFFAGWIILNTPWFGFIPFDPFPFGLLTMIVSLEAIFLSVIVLISQNRQNKVSDIRQRLELEIEVRAEEETTKVLQMIEQIHEHLGIKTKRGGELKQMEHHTDIEGIQRTLEKGE